MKVLIAGGSGLIGHALAALLVSVGDEVTILSRSPDIVMGMPTGVKMLQWDAKTVQAWALELETTDAVVNLTGANISGEGFLPSRWTRQRKEVLLNSRVMSGKVFTEAFSQAMKKPAIFIQASGIGYYGTQQHIPLSEAGAAGDDFLANLSKEWEASSQPIGSMGVRRVVIRNGVVLSTKGGALPLMLLPYRLWVGGRMGSGKQVYSWIHINDEVNAIKFIIHDSHEAGVFNLTAPNPVTNDEFGRTISRVIRKPHYFPIPGFLLKLALGEVTVTVLEGQEVLPKKLLSSGFVFKFPHLEDALRDLLKTQ